MTQTQDNSTLASRAMIAKLKINCWGGEKRDRDVTETVLASHGAVQGAGRFSKSLVSQEFLKPIRAVADAAREDHAELTLPWMNDGARILPSSLFMDYKRKMNRHEAAFHDEQRSLISKYPDAIEARRTELGDMWNEDDYPSEAEISDKFGFDVQIYNVPDARDFRVDLGQEAVDEIRRDMEKRTADLYTSMTDDAQRRLVERVSKLAEKLRGFDPEKHRFRKSLLENVTDVVEILPDLNLADDPRLNDLIEKAREAVNGIQPDDLRHDDQVRNDVLSAADQLMNNAREMFQ